LGLSGGRSDDCSLSPKRSLAGERLVWMTDAIVNAGLSLHQVSARAHLL